MEVVSLGDFTLRQLRYFCAIARAGSISAAAESSNASRSALASALDELEKSLGTVLCVRTKATGVTLTAQGRDVLARAQDVLDASERLEALRSQGEPCGALAVGCFPSLAPTVVPRLWQEALARHPGMSVTVVTDGRPGLLERLVRGEVELIITYDLHRFPELTVLPLYDAELHAIVAAGGELASHERVAAEMLAETPLFVMDVAPGAEETLDWFAVQGVTPRIALRTPHFELIRSLVARGLGHSLFLQRPRIPVSYEGLPIAAVPLDPAAPVHRAELAWLSSRRLSPRALAMVEVATAIRADLAPP